MFSFSEVALPAVTPQMQAAFRTSRKKTLKKGRKSKKGSANKQKGRGKKACTTKNKSVKKRNILKRARPLQSSEESGEEGTDGKKKPRKSNVGTRKASKVKKHSVKETSKIRGKPSKDDHDSKERHFQNRIVFGNSWMYEVLPNQIHGCSNCRCIFNGCKSCKKPGFRGKNAEHFRKVQQDMQTPEVYLPSESSHAKKPPKGKGKVKKGKGTKQKGTKWILVGWASRNLAWALKNFSFYSKYTGLKSYMYIMCLSCCTWFYLSCVYFHGLLRLPSYVNGRQTPHKRLSSANLSDPR